MYVAPPPRSVRISLTDRCDLACIYCRPSRADGYLEERLDDRGWEAMMQGLSRAGVRRGGGSRGGALLHPRGGGMVARLGAPGLGGPALHTHGTRPDRSGGPRWA